MIRFKVIEHIPGFAEGFTPAVAVVDTLEEAVSIPWLSAKGAISLKDCKYFVHDPARWYAMVDGKYVGALIEEGRYDSF